MLRSSSQQPNFDRVDANQNDFADGQEVMRAIGEVIKRDLTTETINEIAIVDRALIYVAVAVKI